MAEYVDFHYTPLEGRITGKQVLKQTEDAINDLGNRVYNAEVTSEDVQEALDNSQQAINIANDALAAVTTDKAVWFNNVADMKTANLVNGNVAATKGYTLYNDGDGAFYAIRQKKGGDVDDGVNIIFLDNGSVAERINEFNLIAKKNIIHVVNVAELKASDGKIGSVYGTLGYYTANDGGAGIYTIRAITASDVDDGGSVIFLENGNVAELIVSDEININQFGGKGDGTTDDNVAIVNAVAYASAKNKRLVFLEGYTYLSSLPIVITTPPDEIRMDGMLQYNGGGTALTIGDANVGQGKKIIHVNVRGSSSHIAGSVGVRFINIDYSTIYLVNVMYFGDCCVEFCGNGRGNAYNNVIIGFVVSAPIGIRLTSIGNNGYCNENKFFGGKIAVYSNDSFKSTSIGILVTSDGNYSQNNNIFYSPCLEGLAVGARIEYGTQHFFYDVRAEGTTKPLDIDDSRLNNAYNYMFASYGTNAYYRNNDFTINPAYLQDGANEYANFNTNLRRSFPITLFDSGVIADNLADNGTNASFGKMIACYGGNMTVFTTSARADITSGELKVMQQLKLGACISTVNNKTFLVDAVTDSKCRFIIWQWDANGNVITNNAPIYANVTISAVRGKVSTLGTSGAVKDGYYSGTDVIPCMLFTVDSNCVKAFVGVTTGTITSFTLSKFRIYTRFDDKVYTLQNYETAVLDTIPTSVGKVGQFVKKTTPTQGEIGWVYDGTQWLSVG